MNDNPNRLKRTLSAVAIAAGLGLGAAGVANAVSSGGQTTAPAAAGTEAGTGAEVQDPSYTSSVQVPESATEENDQAEAAALQAAAKISPEQAKQAALAAVPGTAGKVELENENGNVVYGVEVTANGTTTDVKVDAGNASVLAQETDQKDGTDGGEAPGADAPESGPEAPAAAAN
jgi:uncharacterized membrane protein YkoI